LAQLRAQIPELPEAKRERFISAYGLRAYDATLLTAEREIADYYEATLAAADEAIDPQTVANWVTGELFRLINEAGHALQELPVTPQALAGLLALVERGAITLSTGKQVLGRMYETGRSASQIVKDQGLAQISDAQKLREIVRELLDQHPEQVQQYLAGKTQVLGWLMGQVMRATRGKANPQLARQLLQAQLEALRDH
jgi:aspartyl-tRNA(Asn)/glutamyl-tRNA(Gln) amidotransferase subunit B